MKHKIYLQQQVMQRSAPGSAVVQRWDNFAECWAEIKALRGQEQIEAAQLSDKQFVQINIRYIPGVTSAMRAVREDGRLYHLQGVTNVGRRNRELILTAITSPAEYPRFVYFDEAASAGSAAFMVLLSFSTDAPASTRFRYREAGAGTWTYTTEKDTAPRVFAHSQEIGPLGGGANYEAQVWGEGADGYSPGWGTLLEWGIDLAGVFLPGGYSGAPVILSGPAASNISSSSARITWETDVAAYHRVRRKKPGGAWTVGAWSGSAGTNAVVDLIGLDHYEDYLVDVESCLVGDGSQSTGWVPGDDTFGFKTLCLAPGYANCDVEKISGGVRYTWNTAKTMTSRVKVWNVLDPMFAMQVDGPAGYRTSHVVEHANDFLFPYVDGDYEWYARGQCEKCGTWHDSGVGTFKIGGGVITTKWHPQEP